MNLATAESQTTGAINRVAGARLAGPGYRVTRLQTEEELRDLCQPWAELMAAAAGAPIFLTWEWVSTFWQHRDLGDDLWLLAAWDEAPDHGGMLAGLLPLMLVQERRGPVRMRRLTFIGRGINYPVHLDAILRAGEEQAVAQALLKYLNAHEREWDVLDLGDMNAKSPLRAALPEMQRPLRELTGAPARVSALPATWEIYQKECLSSTRRKHLGQYRRKLEREHPDQVRFYAVSRPDELAWALDAMGELNKSRWHDRRITSAFDHEVFVDFHREMAREALDKGWLRFYVLRVGDEMAASVYGFLYGETFYCYQLTFNAAWGKYGPGNLILGYAIENAIADGAREWNMMRGDQEYKLSWTDEERYDAHVLLGASLAGRLWLAGDGFYDKAKSWGKEHLPRNVRDRITQLISARGLHKHEPAKSKDVSD